MPPARWSTSLVLRMLFQEALLSLQLQGWSSGWNVIISYLLRSGSFLLVINGSYITLMSSTHWRSWRSNITTPGHWALNHSLNRLSSLRSMQPCATNVLLGLINHKNHLCPHWYPSTPGWREAIIEKTLAQGHKSHDRDSNLHSAEQNHQSLSLVLLSARPRHPTSYLSTGHCSQHAHSRIFADARRIFKVCKTHVRFLKGHSNFPSSGKEYFYEENVNLYWNFAKGTTA